MTHRILWQSTRGALGVSSKYNQILIWIGRGKPTVIPINAETLHELKDAILPAIEAYLRVIAAHQLEMAIGELAFSIKMINQIVTQNRAIPNPSPPSDREATAIHDRLIILLQDFAERHRK